MTPEADGVFAFHSPTGAYLAPDPPRQLVEGAPEWLREWADRNRLDLGPEVNLPQWDGKTPNYANAVEWLLAADQ